MFETVMELVLELKLELVLVYLLKEVSNAIMSFCIEIGIDYIKKT